jgi:signal transduction histidine kinase
MLNQLINYFIPQGLKDEPHIYYRTYAFVRLNLFLGFSTLGVDIIIRILNLKNEPDLILASTIILSVLLFTKKFGNLILSGNLMALICFGVLSTSVPNTGGLYSDNLLWMIISPMIALLFCNKRSGFFWLIALLSFIEYQYYKFDSLSPATSFQPSESTYYFISFFTLFIFIYGIIIIFERGQELIIKKLHEKQVLLEAQQKEILQKNLELKAIEEKLRLSNQELENFAYIASHDMKEPLRMIGMYTQLTRKKLNSQLDNSTTDYMNFVTDGVNRMQTLLNDLLQYARLTKEQKDIRPVNLNNVLSIIKHNLQITIKETDTQINSTPLPIITASVSEMSQLFQNLIANAIKFRKTGLSPKIEIAVTERDNEYLFSFKDNGIGIKKEYQEKVFNVFEKLHSQHEYEGSGIGLSTCRKIVENLDGKIWIESAFGYGTTFYFTISKAKTAFTSPKQEMNAELVG